MEEYSYTSTHPLGHTGPVTGSLYLLGYGGSGFLLGGIKNQVNVQQSHYTPSEALRAEGGCGSQHF